MPEVSERNEYIMARRRDAKIESTYRLLRMHARNQSGVSSLWYVVSLAVALENIIRANGNKMFVSIGRKALQLTYHQRGTKIGSGVVANSVLQDVSSVVWDSGQLAEYADIGTLNSMEASLQKTLKDVQRAQLALSEYVAVNVEPIPASI